LPVKGKREIIFRVAPATVLRFDEIFPQHGSRQWFFEACMEAAVSHYGKEDTNEIIEQLVARVIDDRF